MEDDQGRYRRMMVDPKDLHVHSAMHNETRRAKITSGGFCEVTMILDYLANFRTIMQNIYAAAGRRVHDLIRLIIALHRT